LITGLAVLATGGTVLGLVLLVLILPAYLTLRRRRAGR
jgi:hypothetical protein